MPSALRRKPLPKPAPQSDPRFRRVMEQLKSGAAKTKAHPPAPPSRSTPTRSVPPACSGADAGEASSPVQAETIKRVVASIAAAGRALRVGPARLMASASLGARR